MLLLSASHWSSVGAANSLSPFTPSLYYSRIPIPLNDNNVCCYVRAATLLPLFCCYSTHAAWHLLVKQLACSATSAIAACVIFVLRPDVLRRLPFLLCNVTLMWKLSSNIRVTVMLHDRSVIDGDGDNPVDQNVFFLTWVKQVAKAT